MLNFLAKLFFVILVGSLGLGLSSVANADDRVMIDWVPSYEANCPKSCKKTGLKFAFASGFDYSINRGSFFVCITKVGKEWRAGYNQWDKDSCTIGINGKEHEGKEYYCLCSTKPKQPFGR
jgi:hypothetical protein